MAKIMSQRPFRLVCLNHEIQVVDVETQESVFVIDKTVACIIPLLHDLMRGMSASIRQQFLDDLRTTDPVYAARLESASSARH
jgi:hypothetical protein